MTKVNPAQIERDIINALTASGKPMSRHDLWDKITVRVSEHTLDDIFASMKKAGTIVMLPGRRGNYALPPKSDD